MFDENRKAALVTGASRGIGRSIALELARLGFAVAVNYATRGDAAAEVVAEITSAGGVAIAAGGDVGSAADRAALVEQTLAAWGRIDLLVNNAGITSQGRKDILEATEESWDRVFDTNLKGPFFLTQRVANEMLRLIAAKRMESATIINISSVSAYAVSANRADYCLTKAALGMMTHLYAQRLAEAGIQVFEVCPGVIASDMTRPSATSTTALSPRESGRFAVGAALKTWAGRWRPSFPVTSLSPPANESTSTAVFTSANCSFYHACARLCRLR